MASDQRTILVVDRDAAIRDYACAALCAQGHAVVSAADGMDAIARMGSVIPHLILADYVLPPTQGHYFVRALEDDELLPHVPVVFMSFVPSPDRLHAGLTTRDRDYLVKPFTEAQLTEVVDRHIGSAVGRDVSGVVSLSEVDVEGALGDDWLLFSTFREKLHDALADAFAERVGDLAEAQSRTEVVAIIADLLGYASDEKLVNELIDLVRRQDHAP